jgi:asparagine synthase (glutamine-hydrolysing)
MSGFFGIFRPKGGPVDLNAFEQMKTAMQRDGFDGMETHVEEQIAMGHLMLRVSPESKYDKQPLKSSCGNYLLVGHFRLDYRDELGDKLGLTQAELERTPDSQLAMLSYLKWKEKCVHHLEGDWAFVVFNISKCKISFYRDHSGTSCLAYRKIDSFILFSSNINVLTDSTTYTPTIDKIQLCRLLVPGLGLRAKCTVFLDTFILTNSEILSFDQNLSSESVEFCPFKLEARENNFKFEADYILELASIFSMAVKSRLAINQKNGLFLSSGFDSTAVAYYAAKNLNAYDEKLLTFTSYPFYSNINEGDLRDINEKPLVEEFVDMTGSIVSHYLDLPHSKFIDLFSDQNQTAFRPLIGINDFWIKGIYEMSFSIGVKSFLNGQLGNNIISYSTTYQYLTYLNSGKLLLLINSCKPFLKWLFIKDSTFDFRDSLLADIYRLARRKIQVWSNRKKIQDSSFLIKEFISRHDWKTELKDMPWSPMFFANIDSRATRLSSIKSTLYYSGIIWYENSHSYGMIATDPTADQRMISYSLALPQTCFKQKQTHKYIYKKWMYNKSPKSILSRKDRIMQSADVGIRFMHDSEMIHFTDNCLKDLKYSEIVDYDDFQSILSQVKDSNSSWYSKRVNFSRILKILSLISYLDSKKSKIGSN